MKNEITKKLDSAIATGLSAKVLTGFEKALTIAGATTELQNLLTPAVLKNVVSLAGTKLGFKTDRKPDSQYSVEVIKDCLIEAVLTGVQPVGNQFNIIAGNCYVTKEGFGYLLGKIEDFNYKIIPDIPKVSGSSAVIKMNISWTYKGKKDKEAIEFPIKTNSYMGPDAIIGKATRKARAWLYSYITGSELSDGEAEEVEVGIKPSEMLEPQKDKQEKKNIEEAQEVFDPEIILQENGFTMKDLIEFAEFKQVDKSIVIDSMKTSTKKVIAKMQSWRA